MALYNTSIDYANFWEEQLSTLKIAGWILIGLFLAAAVLAIVPGGQGFSAFLFTTWGLLLGIGAAIGVALVATAYVIEHSDKYKNGMIQREALIKQINDDPKLSPEEKEKLKAEARRYHGDYKPSGWPKLALALANPIAKATVEASEAATSAVETAGHVIKDAGKAIDNIADTGTSLTKLISGKAIVYLGIFVASIFLIKSLNGTK